MTSTTGMIALRPGSRGPSTRPNRRTTPCSYCLTILIDKRNPITTRMRSTTRTIPSVFRGVAPYCWCVDIELLATFRAKGTSGQHRWSVLGAPMTPRVAASTSQASAVSESTPTDDSGRDPHVQGLHSLKPGRWSVGDLGQVVAIDIRCASTDEHAPSRVSFVVDFVHLERGVHRSHVLGERAVGEVRKSTVSLSMTYFTGSTTGPWSW